MAKTATKTKPPTKAESVTNIDKFLKKGTVTKDEAAAGDDPFDKDTNENITKLPGDDPEEEFEGDEDEGDGADEKAVAVEINGQMIMPGMPGYAGDRDPQITEAGTAYAECKEMREKWEAKEKAAYKVLDQVLKDKKIYVYPYDDLDIKVNEQRRITCKRKNKSDPNSQEAKELSSKRKRKGKKGDPEPEAEPADEE